MDLETKALHAEERLFEFYDVVELEYFVRFCSENNIPNYEGMLFLDGQTRADYWISQIDPRICDYMKRTLEVFSDNK